MLYSPGIAMTKASFNGKTTLFASKLDDMWSTVLYGAETWTLGKPDQQHLESCEMWWWRRMEKISWTDRVKNEEVLHRVKEERNVIYTIKRRKADWIGDILCRKCLLQYIIEGKIKENKKVTWRQGGRSTQLLDDLTWKRVLQIWRENTRSHSVENSLLKRIWICR